MRSAITASSSLVAVCILLSIAPADSRAQRQKPKAKPIVVFTVADAPVTANEFIYLYRKNHLNTGADYTAEKIEEYLTLYINFKLKVHEAKARGMDTTANFLKEYNSYKEELRKPYLPETKLTDSLVRLTYSRMREEISASHILIAVPPDAAPADTLKAYQRALEIRSEVLAGMDFGDAAVASSADPSAKVNRGNLGYFTALQMVYPFENAVYAAVPGQVSLPVRTQFGYHIIKVNDRRPSQGEIEVSHIMIRTGDSKNDTDVRNRIFAIYDQLQGGMGWDDLCRQYSEDPATRNNGGRLRAVRAGSMAAVPEFEAAAFNLKNPGDISDPVQTQYGWHIIRLERKIPLPDFDEAAPNLRGRVLRDERTSLSRQAMMEKLRQQHGFREDPDVKRAVLSLADSSLQKPGWHPPVAAEMQGKALFTLDNQPYRVADFLTFAQKHQKPNSEDPRNYFEGLLNDFVDARIMERAEMKIVADNPSFGYLLQEYYEGILLFEIMEQEVWNKATADTAGLRSYYEEHLDHYAAPERAEAVIYSSGTANYRQPLQRLIESGKLDEIQTFVSREKIRQESGVFTRAEKAVLQKMPWAPGVYSTENNGMYYLAWLKAIRPVGTMSLDESRPTIITDYQAFLEERWLTQLKGKYTVKVNGKGKKYILAQLLEK